jgi:hypothetical protein
MLPRTHEVAGAVAHPYVRRRTCPSARSRRGRGPSARRGPSSPSSAQPGRSRPGKGGCSSSVALLKASRANAGSLRPVIAARHDDSLLIALPYGKRTDWLKNVLGRGSAAIVASGNVYEVDHPEVIPIALTHSGERVHWGWCCALGRRTRQLRSAVSGQRYGRRAVLLAFDRPRRAWRVPSSHAS